VVPEFFLILVYTDPGLDIDVIIHPFNIGKGMMIDIVFVFPQKYISTHDVQGIAHQYIHPGFCVEAAMRSVMHDIESDAGKVKSHQTAQNEGNPGNRCEKYENGVK
jgi:hypothetical protein